MLTGVEGEALLFRMLPKLEPWLLEVDAGVVLGVDRGNRVALSCETGGVGAEARDELLVLKAPE